jgi:hypothetical protein
MITRSTITLALFSICLFVSAQKEQRTKYPVVISFISYGAGVPDSKPVMSFIRTFQKKNKIKVIKIDTIGRRGKEGEYDLALLLRELTEKQKRTFIQQVKKVTKQKGDPGEIQFKENVSSDEPKNRDRFTPQKIKIE